MSQTDMWVVATLLMAPLWSASGQRAARPPSESILRPGDALRITVWRHPEISRDSEVAVDLAGGYATYGALPIASGDQVVVARRAGFNVLRDLLVPVTSLTAAVAAVFAYSRR